MSQLKRVASAIAKSLTPLYNGGYYLSEDDAMQAAQAAIDVMGEPEISLREGKEDIAYDRGYGDGVNQAVRELWQYVRGERGDDRWWDELADHLKNLDRRAELRIADARAAKTELLQAQAASECIPSPSPQGPEMTAQEMAQFKAIWSPIADVLRGDAP